MIKNLTPKRAWDVYVGNSVKLFMSLFYDDGITDVKEMCKAYAKDLPNATGNLYTLDQLDYIEKLFLQHVESTGYNKDDIYTREELDEIWNKEVNSILSLILK